MSQIYFVCVISDEPTMSKFNGIPVHKEVLKFARHYKATKKIGHLKNILVAFAELRRIGFTWKQIKQKCIDELKELSQN